MALRCSLASPTVLQLLIFVPTLFSSSFVLSGFLGRFRFFLHFLCPHLFCSPRTLLGLLSFGDMYECQVMSSRSRTTPSTPLLRWQGVSSALSFVFTLPSALRSNIGTCVTATWPPCRPIVLPINACWIRQTAPLPSAPLLPVEQR